MTHRSALFAAVLGLGRAGSNVGDHFVQSDYCARVKGATDDKPVHFSATPEDEPTVHGTSDGIKAYAWHCLSVGVAAQVPVGRSVSLLAIGLAGRRIGVRQMSCRAGSRQQ
ncbi:hypothetical protein [Streptomyces sp. NPDC090112]|uniref:hypothetical protein n=1 Tax=Streptomyces sp. NPDC090112 TaxID=3365949 RepID=UPI0038242BA4